MSFERLYNPRGIAVIGASADLSRISGQPIAALKNAGYKGGIYLVNPKYQELHGLKCFPAAAAIKQPCDLALIAVPSNGVAAAVRDCGAAGIPFAIILTAGFREAGAEGRKLEAELAKAGQDSGVRFIGPNCQGAMSIPSCEPATVNPVQPIGGGGEYGGNAGAGHPDMVEVPKAGRPQDDVISRPAR
jgi:acetyltransferase